MKNSKTKYIVVIIALILLILIGMIEIFIFSKPKNNSQGDSKNQYFVSSEKIEEDLKTYTNDNLQKIHCVDSVCIENVTFHYDSNSGRIDYLIENQSDKTSSGYLKLIFENQSFIISYEKLEPNQKTEGSSYYEKIEIQNREDYVLEKLKEEEKDKIVYINQ